MVGGRDRESGVMNGGRGRVAWSRVRGHDRGSWSGGVVKDKDVDERLREDKETTTSFWIGKLTIQLSWGSQKKKKKRKREKN